MWHNVPERLREKKLTTQIPIQAKIPFKSENEMKTFPDRNN